MNSVLSKFSIWMFHSVASIQKLWNVLLCLQYGVKKSGVEQVRNE